MEIAVDDIDIGRDCPTVEEIRAVLGPPLEDVQKTRKLQRNRENARLSRERVRQEIASLRSRCARLEEERSSLLKLLHTPQYALHERCMFLETDNVRMHEMLQSLRSSGEGSGAAV